MKKTVQREIEICDVCREAEANRWSKCDRCGNAFCYECRKTGGVEYAHGVYSGGSGDGFYCAECNSALIKSGKDPIFNAFQVIMALRSEIKFVNDSIEARRVVAEATLKTAQRRRAS